MLPIIKFDFIKFKAYFARPALWKRALFYVVLLIIIAAVAAILMQA